MSANATAHRLGAECPICRHQFPTGTTGWYSHVGAMRNHPNWHPEITDPIERAATFELTFPHFFAEAWTPSRRHTSDNVRSLADYHAASPPIPKPQPPPVVSARYCPHCGVALAQKGDVL